jgi:uncharacterized protein DUF4261
MGSAAGVYSVELLYAEEPAVDAARLLGALRARLGAVDRIDGTAASLAFVAHDVIVRYGEVETSAQIVVSPTDGSYDPALAAASLEHTWDWTSAQIMVSRARRSLVVGDFFARTLAPADRLRFVAEAVRAVAGVAPPLAIDWRPAQKIIDPVDGLAAQTLPFNVRYFTFSGDRDGRALMDTRGLDVLGLPDIECIFVGLAPAEVASHLYGMAARLVNKGPVRDGHILTASDGRRWICRKDQATVGPDRQVLTLEPEPAAEAQATSSRDDQPAAPVPDKQGQGKLPV